MRKMGMVVKLASAEVTAGESDRAVMGESSDGDESDGDDGEWPM